MFVDQDKFSDPDFISGTHQRENVQFAYDLNYCYSGGRQGKLPNTALECYDFTEDSGQFVTRMQKNISQSDVTNKNNNVSFEGIDRHYH
jgi:hypothetical protein